MVAQRLVENKFYITKIFGDKVATILSLKMGGPIEAAAYTAWPSPLLCHISGPRPTCTVWTHQLPTHRTTHHFILLLFYDC